MTLLNRDEIIALGTLPPRVLALWSDVEVLAAELHSADDADRPSALHHLITAILNVTSPQKVYLPAVNRPGATDGLRQHSLMLTVAPGREVKLSVDDPSSWQRLARQVSGLGIPRTTALLAALWPDQHVMIDWRAMYGAFALHGPAAGWPAPLPAADESGPQLPSWERYDWFRTAVLQTAKEAQLPPARVEQALQLLAGAVDAEPTLAWQHYADLVAEVRGTLTDPE
jgi:hypothetical protein